MTLTMVRPLSNVDLPRHVLIVGVNYWPEVTGNAPYTTGLAEHLAARGSRVTVLTGMPYYPQWRVLDGYRGKLRYREMVGGVDVHHFRQYVPGRQSALRRALFEATFLSHVLPFLKVPRPDVVLGVLPNLAGGLLAALAASRTGSPLGLLFQDLTGQGAGQSGIPGGKRVEWVTRAVEGRIARRADAIAIVAEGFRSRLEDLGVEAARIHRVRNWTHVGRPSRPPAEVRAQLGLPAGAWICLHAGNMGFKQGLDNVVAAARLAATQPDPPLFVLMGDGNQRADLQALAADLPNVRFLPPQPEADFADTLAAADVLLVNQRPSVTDMSLPGKLTSYFVAGRPVVAAVAAGSETAAEIAAAGAGMVVDAGAPQALLAAIRDLEANPGRAAHLGGLGPAYAGAHLSADSALATLERFVAATANRAAIPTVSSRSVGSSRAT